MKNDANKSKIFSKLSRQIKTALKEAGGDRESLAVTTAVTAAKQAGMPKSSIQTALSLNAKNGKDAAALEYVTYEGTGPKGVAFIVRTLTEKRQRTSPAMRHIFYQI